jgi:hypothetical protein
MMAGVIVFGSAVFAAALVVAWLLRPDLRAWMERPKHRFQDDVRRYDDSFEASGHGRTRVRS